MTVYFYLPAALVAACVTFAGCRLAISREMMPNVVTDRSSHESPVSRAGGAVLISAFLLVALVTGFFLPGGWGGGITTLLILTAFGAMIGLADDLYELSPLRKFFGQFCLAVFFVAFAGGISILPLPFMGLVSGGVAGKILAVLWIVGFLNSFNFMDGLNGMAGLAALAGLVAMAVFTTPAGLSGLMLPSLLLAGAIAGFLVLNFPGGQIFLGDAGSHGIGTFLAGLALLAPQDSAAPVGFLFLPVMFLPFILDVAVTLILRARRGAPLHQAHKEHFYQRLHQAGWSHGKVSFTYLAAILFSGAGAMVVLRLPPQWQVFAILVISLLLLVGARLIAPKTLHQ